MSRIRLINNPLKMEAVESGPGELKLKGYAKDIQ